MQQIHRWTLRQSSFVLKCSFKDKNVSCAYKGTENTRIVFRQNSLDHAAATVKGSSFGRLDRNRANVVAFFFSCQDCEKKEKIFVNHVSERGLFARMIGATPWKTCSQSANFAQSVLLNRIKLKKASLVGLFHNPYLTN